MARRRAIDRYRKIRRRAEASEKLRQEAGGGEMKGTTGDRQMIPIHEKVQDAPVLSDLRRFLMQIVGTLPKEQERVIQLSYFNQLSQREIASRTGDSARHDQDPPRPGAAEAFAEVEPIP